MKDRYIVAFYAYKSLADFQVDKDKWVGSTMFNLKLEDFKSLENTRYDGLTGFYLELEDLKALKTELESEAIEFKNNLKSDGVKFIQAYVYIDDNCVINMIADISYNFSEK